MNPEETWAEKTLVEASALHAKVIEAIDHRITQGNFALCRIAERHAPIDRYGIYCGHEGIPQDGGSVPWPCADFRDVAALVGIWIDGSDL